MECLTSDHQPTVGDVASGEELEPLIGPTSEEGDSAVDNIAPGLDHLPLTNNESEVPQPTTADSVSPSINSLSINNPTTDNTAKDQEDQTDPLAELGVCGLRNIGNTCYMNASLQCLRSLPELIQHCLSSQPPSPLSEEADKLEKAMTCRTHVHATFASLVKKLWSGQFSAVQPRLFKTTIGLLYSQFSGNRQHDSQEFLAMLLDSLDEHCSSESSSIINDTFQGELRNEVLCSECGNVSVKVEPFVFLSLPLPGAYDRIIELYFIGAKCPPIVSRLAVTVCRYGSVVEDIKTSLRARIKREVPSELLVMAEVMEGTVLRTLADSLPLDRLSSKHGEKLYMFEMTPAQDLVSSLRTPRPSSFDAIVDSSEDTSVEVAMETNVIAMETEAPTVVMMEWHSCNICLEEMMDSDLLTHAQCGGTMCKNCLEASRAHQEASEAKRSICPICSKPLSEENNFKPMMGEGGTSNEDAISLLLMTVLCRNFELLVGHPFLRHLPTQAQGEVFYREVTKCLPPSLSTLPFTLKLTDDKGRCCSRCDFTSKCSGCLLDREGSGELKPGDHLTVQFTTPLSTEQLQILENVVEHPSLSLLVTRQLTLNDCLDSFAQREILSQENSWYCPWCQCQRLAERTLSVERVPQTLIVHLKRFIYHGREGSKVEGGVSFPTELSGVSANDSSTLQLTACICHTGTLHFGHYTAYCKHPCTGEWIYYNDSSCTKVAAPDCQDSVYMLFYQKPTSSLTVEATNEEFDDSIERVATETLLRLFKPPDPKPPLPPPLPLKRYSSNPDVSKTEEAEPAVKLLKVVACPW